MKTSTFLQNIALFCSALSVCYVVKLVVTYQMSDFNGYVLLTLVSASAIANIVSLIVKKYE